MLQRRLTSSSFRSHGQGLNVDVEIAGMNNKKNPHDNSVLTYLSRNIDINRRRAQIKQLAWPMAERQIGHRKSCLVLSVLFSVVNWRSRPVAKSAY